MTYQEIVDNFRAVIDNHEIINEFGYGAISDIKTNNTNLNPNAPYDYPSQESMTLYPYVYLVPQQSTRTSQAITYRFNMIVMDTVLPNGLELTRFSYYEEDQKDPPYGTTLKVQSDCQQYIDDILAKLKLGKNESRAMDIQLNVNLTPFKERFQDTVAGMTATIELEIAQPLNLCIAPVYDGIPELIETFNYNDVQNIDYNYQYIDFWDIPKAPQEYRIEYVFDVNQNVALSGDPSPNQYPMFTIFEDSDSPAFPSRYLSQTSFRPVTVGDEVNFRGQVEFTTRDGDPDDRRIFFGFGYIGDYPNGTVPTFTPDAVNITRGKIRIYKLK